MSIEEDQIKALASDVRLEILRVLDQPAEHFSHQQSADPVETGVCVQLIAEHFQLSQPTISRHIELLKRAGFIVTQRQQKWTYCRRDEHALSEYFKCLRESLHIREA